MKKIIKLLIFVLIFLIILHYASLLLVRKGNGYGTDVLNFYKQDRNSIDILYLGSSHAYSSFNPYLIEKKYNLKGYVFATQQQPLWITYYYLDEALKYQKPKYVVLEVHMAVAGNNNYAEEQINRDALDKMKFSINKIKAINASVESKKERLSYYFNIIKYHTRYKELTYIDFKTAFLNYSINNKGYIGLPNTDYIFNYVNNNTEEILQISDKNEKYLNKIIALAKEKNIKLILVKTPAAYDEESNKKLNYINQIAINNNIQFFNYVKNIDSLDLDYQNDFYDPGHLNKIGSDKLSDKFCEDLKSIN